MTKLHKVYAVLAAAGVCAVAIFIATGPHTESGQIKLIETYLLENSTNLSQNTKSELQNAANILKTNPGFSSNSAEALKGRRLCIYDIKKLIKDIKDGKCIADNCLSASIMVGACNSNINDNLNSAEMAAFRSRMDNLEKSAEEAGMIRNNKNVIPRVGSSCPSGYVVDGDYCQQR